MTTTPPSAVEIEELLAHADWLRGLAALVARGDAVEDVIQDSWVAGLRSPPAQGPPIRRWLATVMRNLARRRARASAAGLQRLDPDGKWRATYYAFHDHREKLADPMTRYREGRKEWMARVKVGVGRAKYIRQLPKE